MTSQESKKQLFNNEIDELMDKLNRCVDKWYEKRKKEREQKKI